jgi:uncharacterized membrane protein YfhO
MLALAGILYVGFKKFKEARNAKNSSLSKNQHQTPIQNKIKQVVEETSDSDQKSLKKQLFEKKVKEHARNNLVNHPLA